MDSIMFKRGKDPRKSMGVGKINYYHVDDIQITVVDEQRNPVGQKNIPIDLAPKFIEKIVDERKIDFDIIIQMFSEFGNYIRVELYSIKIHFLINRPDGVVAYRKDQMYDKTIIYRDKYYQLPNGRA